MKRIDLTCRFCSRLNQIPASRPVSFFRCESCCALNSLNLSQRLAFMREADAPLPLTIVAKPPASRVRARPEKIRQVIV